jgi:hypothetical protein
LFSDLLKVYLSTKEKEPFRLHVDSDASFRTNCTKSTLIYNQWVDFYDGEEHLDSSELLKILNTARSR